MFRNMMLVEEIVNILFSLIFSHLNLFIHTYIENGVAQLKLKKAVSVDLGHIIFIFFIKI